MKEIMKLWLVAFCVQCCMACTDSDPVSGEFEPLGLEYELPQGKSDADDRIVDFYNKYSSLILYDYPALEWNYEFGSQGYIDYVYELPDPAYVGEALDFLEDIWFDFFPEEFNREFIPYKILLAGKFTSTYNNSAMPLLYASKDAVMFGFCSDTLRNLTPETKQVIKRDLFSQALSGWMLEIEIPEEFYAISDYSSAATEDPSSPDYARKRGFVADYSYVDYYGPSEWCTWVDWLTGMLNKTSDMLAYLTGMTHRTSNDWKADWEYPLVKQKYDILRNFFIEKYDVDLQKIGDAVYE